MGSWSYHTRIFGGRKYDYAGPGWDFSPTGFAGTGGWFARPINMNKYARAKTLSGARVARAQNASRTGGTGTAFRRQRKGLSLDSRPLFRPARELLIDLGWLRLFQTIAFPRYAIDAGKEFGNE